MPRNRSCPSPEPKAQHDPGRLRTPERRAGLAAGAVGLGVGGCVVTLGATLLATGGSANIQTKTPKDPLHECSCDVFEQA